MLSKIYLRKICESLENLETSIERMLLFWSIWIREFIHRIPLMK